MNLRIATPRRLAWLIFAGGVAWVMNFVAVAFTARILGSASFGLLAFGLSVAAYATVLAAPGLNVWGVRAVSQDRSAVGRYLVVVNGTQFALGLVAYFMLVLAANLLLIDEQRQIVIVAGIVVFVLGFGVQWVCQALERYDLMGVSQLLTAGVSLAIILILVRSPADRTAVPVAMVIGQVIGGLATLTLLWRSAPLHVHRVRVRDALRALRTSVALGVAPVLITVLHNSNTLFLQATRGSADVGIFTSGYRLVETLAIVPTLVTSLYFPRLARAASGSPEWVNEMRAFVSLTMGLAFLPTILMAIDGESVALLLYGGEYVQAGDVIRVMAFGTLFNFAAIAYLMGVLAAHRDGAYLASLGAATVASVVGGVLLVPVFGLWGATVVVSVLDLLAWSLTLRTHWRLSRTLFLGEWVRPALAALLVATWLLLASAIGVAFVPRVAIAGIVYLAIVFIRPTAGAVMVR